MRVAAPASSADVSAATPETIWLQLPCKCVLGSRTYSPGLARWLTKVRMEEMLAGEHPYAYANNNPATYIDPDGLQPFQGGNPYQNLIDKFGKGMEKEIGTIPGKIKKECLGGCDTDKLLALMKASNVMGFSKGHDRTNALGHCMTACLIARELPDCIPYWNAREIGAMFGHSASVMDDWNNRIGYGLSKKKGSCEDLCRANVDRLTWYEPRPHNWPPGGGHGGGGSW